MSAYNQFPNVHTAFGGNPPVRFEDLPETQAEAVDFGNRIENAMRELLAAIPTYGARGQLAHNAFMLSGLMGLAYDKNPTLINPIRERVTPIWQQIYDLHRASPYGSSEGMLPPALPLDPLEVELANRLWPGQTWLVETPAAAAPVITALPVTTTTVATTGQQTPIQPTAASQPPTVLGFPLWQVALAAAGVFFVFNSSK